MWGYYNNCLWHTDQIDAVFCGMLLLGSLGVAYSQYSQYRDLLWRTAALLVPRVLARYFIRVYLWK